MRFGIAAEPMKCDNALTSKRVMDEKTFAEKATTLRRTALTVSLSICADAEMANDVAQETLVKLWSMRQSLDGYRSLEALTSVIARHETIDQMRRRRNVPLDSSLDIEDLHASPFDEMVSTQELKWIEQQLLKLPSTQHTVLVMRQVEGRSFEEIASLLDIEISSARSLLSRARRNLLTVIKKRNEKQWN